MSTVKRLPSATTAMCTLSPQYKNEALAELREAVQFTEKFWCDESTVVIDTVVPFDAMSAKLRSISPVFVRHIMPVHATFEYAYDLDDIKDFLRGQAGAIHTDYVIQPRWIGEHILPFSTSELTQTIEAALGKEASNGYSKDDIAVSAVIHDTTMYIGMSFVHNNLNPWAGGMRHYKLTDDMISRAEFKLLEALELFNVRLPKNGTAIDLGAAPGGWTYILRQKGLHVIAIDPGELDKRLQSDEGITHMQRKAQEAFPFAEQADCIVNDMRMNGDDSAYIMSNAATSLHTGAIGIMTIKLPEENPLPVLKKTVKILSRHYKIISVRQLFHNRHEATIFLSRS